MRMNWQSSTKQKYDISIYVFFSFFSLSLVLYAWFFNYNDPHAHRAQHHTFYNINTHTVRSFNVQSH